MPNPLDDARYELALANRIIAHEGVLDAFGHVSMRHPTDPGRYLLARSRSPELIEPSDIYEFTLDSEPVSTAPVAYYGERVIHGCIYQARPDVNAVCHHHSPSVLPFCVTGVELVPVFHMGAVLGTAAPFWDSRDDFGDTNMLVIKPEEGASLARALGKHWMVLMMRHGVTVAGASVRDCVFRSVFSARNAEYQVRAMSLGSNIATLSSGETKLAGQISSKTTGLTRSWEYWSMRVTNKAGGFTLASKKSGQSRAKTKQARTKGKSKRATKRRR